VEPCYSNSNNRVTFEYGHTVVSGRETWQACHVDDTNVAVRIHLPAVQRKGKVQIMI
jgi:hypothetical protein